MPSSPSNALAPGFSADEFRQALGMFATGVTIVTGRTSQGKLIGLTANSFNSVSLNPPLVLWSLWHQASTMGAFREGSHYAINILSADQQELALRFAKSRSAQFTDLDYVIGAGGAPVLQGCVATFECFNRSRYDEGDHTIFVGEVERCSHHSARSPLLFHGGKFYTEHPL
jgi:flavin reductase (DIM6/NTAB) family NADH-FMN oxidoreductase RutF